MRLGFRRALRALFVLLALAGVATLAGTAALLFPYFRDDAKLDHLVLAVALDWRDFGLDKAMERFEFERQQAGLGGRIKDDACRFRPGQGGEREVLCQWGIVLNVPGGLDIPIRFESRATVDADGELR